MPVGPDSLPKQLLMPQYWLDDIFWKWLYTL